MKARSVAIFKCGYIKLKINSSCREWYCLNRLHYKKLCDRPFKFWPKNVHYLTILCYKKAMCQCLGISVFPKKPLLHIFV